LGANPPRADLVRWALGGLLGGERVLDAAGGREDDLQQVLVPGDRDADRPEEATRGVAAAVPPGDEVLGDDLVEHETLGEAEVAHLGFDAHGQAADAVVVRGVAEGAEGGEAGVGLGLVLFGGASGRGTQYAQFDLPTSRTSSPTLVFISRSTVIIAVLVDCQLETYGASGRLLIVHGQPDPGASP
jgi:hypothetical protein